MEHVMERFQRLPLGNICDANGKRGSMDPAIRPVDPSLHMVGRAYTVRCHPGDNLAIHKAITEAPDGSVLVIDAGGYTGGGHIGEIMCFACMQRGIRGLVIDGTCRDADDIQALGFPVFSRGFNPGGTVKETVGQTEIPIVCGGVPCGRRSGRGKPGRRGRGGKRKHRSGAGGRGGYRPEGGPGPGGTEAGQDHPPEIYQFSKIL